MHNLLSLPVPKAQCYKDHKPLELTHGLYVYGGNALRPVIHNADIYIDLDGGNNREIYPWDNHSGFIFTIQNSGVPVSVSKFKKLIVWTAVQIREGKKVHIGCVGGHGRTGLVLSALVNHMMGLSDSTMYVRDNYCSKSVESARQVNWLFRKFGIQKVKPTLNLRRLELCSDVQSYPVYNIND